MHRAIVTGLQLFPLFRDIRAGTLAVLASACSLRDYADGGPIVSHHDATFDVFFLLAGRALVSLYSADGQRVDFLDLLAGEMFGEISAQDGLPRSASVEARGVCRAAVLPHAQFIALMQQDHGFAAAVARQLAAHVRRLTTRVFEFSTMAVRQRLRAELLRLAEKNSAGADRALIEPMPTHAELASRISTHREAVSREMATLDGQGLGVKHSRSLLIPSLARMRSSLHADGGE